MKRLFGTDGIRGTAGDEPLTPATVRMFGAALAEEIAPPGRREVRVALGRDTRVSGPWLRDAVAAGLAARGARAVDAGVVSTPGLAWIVQAGGFDAGVMISASHNPFGDNGLKVFGRDGAKVPDAREASVERRILDHGIADPGSANGALREDHGLVEGYLRHLRSAVPTGRLAGLRLVLDCAHGSASALAPALYRDLGAEVSCLGCEPDGRNINLDCGSLHLDRLAREVRERGADAGIAFDGDADRALAVDSRGRVVDGDAILWLCARHLRRAGRLPGGTVVATVMSNLWLERRLAEEGMRLLRAPVGDKYVLERMDAEGAVLGGEQSGHVIFRELATTGDGMLTGLVLLHAVQEEPVPLAGIVDGIVPCPQILLNIRVASKPDLAAHPSIGPLLREIEADLGGGGRVLLRYSGTEPLARVMVEGVDEAAVRRHAERLAEAIRREIGM